MNLERVRSISQSDARVKCLPFSFDGSRWAIDRADRVGNGITEYKNGSLSRSSLMLSNQR